MNQSTEQKMDTNTSVSHLKLPGTANTLQKLGLAFAFGYVFSSIGVPIGWMTGALAAGVVISLVQGRPKPLPTQLLILSQIIIGLASAVRFSPETLTLAQNFALPLFLCISVTAGLSLLNGFLLWRLTGLDRATSFLGTIPGAASSIVAMSQDYGAEAMSVAILQYIRVMLLALLVPSAAGWFAGSQNVNPSVISLTIAGSTVVQPIWVNLLCLTGCGVLGTALGRFLRLPAPAFLGSFLLGLAVFLRFPHQFYVQSPIFMTGLTLLGLAIGLKFDWNTIKQLRRAVVIELGLILVLLLACLTSGYEFHLVTQVDTLTALLGFVPGGIEAMVATVTELGGDTGVVVAIQMVRQLLILLIINLLNVFYRSSPPPVELEVTVGGDQ